LPSKKSKTPTKKPTVTKKKPAPATKKAPAKKPAAKKAAPQTAAKKPVAKKPVTKKPVAKKPVAKKTVTKKPVATKTISKKTTAKAAPKKAPAKKPALKTVAKAAPAKKPVAKSTPKKEAPQKPQLSIVRDAKKPLAPLKETKVKTSSVAYNITPIKAPQAVAAKPKPVPAKTTMNLPILPPDYEPTDTEEFMSPVMKEYFRQRLIAWRDELLRESEETLHTLHEDGNMQKPDITDRASEETDLAIEFRTRDRERKLINKINEAIGRIEDGSYGYCEETGDPIPVKRLIARPTAVRTLEAEELHERRERTQRDQYE